MKLVNPKNVAKKSLKTKNKKRIEMKKYRRKNPQYKLDQCKKAKINRIIDRYLCIWVYSNGEINCACCGEKNFFVLTLDHIDGLGAKHRKEIGVTGSGNFAQWLRLNNFPPGIQVLCYNCNFAKEKCGGVCPHELFADLEKFTLNSTLSIIRLKTFQYADD